jgi:hypothetical protein
VKNGATLKFKPGTNNEWVKLDPEGKMYVFQIFQAKSDFLRETSE